MKLPKHPLAFLAALGSIFVLTANGADLFQITASTTDGSGITTTLGSSSVLNLSEQLINNTSQFSSLQGHSYLAILNYGGVANAMAFRVTQGSLYTASLTTPFDPGVINRSFQAQSQSGLYSEIKDYLKSSGSGDWAKFLAALNRNTAAGVTDGNPHAATAQQATGSFFQYAFAPTQTEEESSQADNSQAGQPGAAAASDSTSRMGLAFTAEAGTFNSKGVHGDTYSVSPMIPVKLTDRVRLELTVPLSYTKIEGAKEYGAGLQLALPILLVKHTRTQPWTWQLSPLGGAVAAGSEDMLSGGIIANGGLASYAAYRWHKWEFSLGDSVSFYEGVKVRVDGYAFDPGVSQEIFKNGLKAGRQLGKRWYAEVYGIDTRFAQAAFIQHYYTVGGGVGYHGPKKKGFIMIGGYTDFADHYTSAKMQFGTGWKF